jgi:hypothetical protein
MRALTMEELKSVSGGVSSRFRDPDMYGTAPDPFSNCAHTPLGSPGQLEGGGQEVSTITVIGNRTASGDSDGNETLSNAEYRDCVLDEMNSWGSVAGVISGTITGARIAIGAVGITVVTSYGGYAIAASGLAGGGAALAAVFVNAGVACRSLRPF